MSLIRFSFVQKFTLNRIPMVQNTNIEGSLVPSWLLLQLLSLPLYRSSYWCWLKKKFQKFWHLCRCNCQTTPLRSRCNQVHLSQTRQLPALYKIPEMSCQEIRIYKLTRNLFPQQKSISKWDLGKIEFHVDFVLLLKECAFQSSLWSIDHTDPNCFSHSVSFLFVFSFVNTKQVFNQNLIKTDLSRWILIPICSRCPIMVLSDCFPATTIFIPTPNMRGWERASLSHYPLIPLLSSSVLSSL